MAGGTPLRSLSLYPCFLKDRLRAHHRGKGCAKVVACALIDDCLRQGLEPVWACRLENVASVNLASQLGFVAGARVPYYRLPGGYVDAASRNC